MAEPPRRTGAEGEVTRLAERVRAIREEAEGDRDKAEGGVGSNRRAYYFFLILGVSAGLVAAVFGGFAGGTNDASLPGWVAGIAGAIAGASTGALGVFRPAARLAYNQLQYADFADVALRAENALATEKSTDELGRVLEDLTSQLRRIRERTPPA
jgi:hypothetical protein